MYNLFFLLQEQTNKLKDKYIYFYTVFVYKIIKTRKILKTLKNHRSKMNVRVNVRMARIIRTLIKVEVRTYATYANYRTL